MIWLTMQGVDSQIAHAWKVRRGRPICGIAGIRGPRASERLCKRCERSLHRKAARRRRRPAFFRQKPNRVLRGQLELPFELLEGAAS